MRIWRRTELRTLAFAGLAAGLAIIALCLILVVRTSTSQQFRTQTATNCQSIEDLKATIRATFLEAQARALDRENLDASQRRAVIDAYAKELVRYRADECPTP